jgi:hypothetical protein
VKKPEKLKRKQSEEWLFERIYRLKTGIFLLTPPESCIKMKYPVWKKTVCRRLP